MVAGRSNVVDIFDAQTGSWSNASLSGDGRCCLGAAGGNTSFAFFGGQANQPLGGDVADVFTFQELSLAAAPLGDTDTASATTPTDEATSAPAVSDQAVAAVTPSPAWPYTPLGDGNGSFPSLWCKR